MPQKVGDELRAHVTLLEQRGLQLGRPWCDTPAGSAYSNMKELRFNADDGVWRVAFAFDPRRRGILLTAGDKKGANQTRFYDRLIRIADARYAAHLKRLKSKNRPKKGRKK